MPNTSMNTYKHSSTSNIISNKRKLLSRLVFILCKKTSEKSGKKTVFIKAFYLTLCIFFLRFLHNFVLCIAANISNVCEIFFVAFLYFFIHVRCFFHFAKLPVTIVVWFVSKTWFFSLFLDVVVEPSCNYTTNTLYIVAWIYTFFFLFLRFYVCMWAGVVAISISSSRIFLYNSLPCWNFFSVRSFCSVFKSFQHIFWLFSALYNFNVVPFISFLVQQTNEWKKNVEAKEEKKNPHAKQTSYQQQLQRIKWVINTKVY